MIPLSQCRWRAQETVPGRHACHSPKLIVGPQGVPDDGCGTCYCRDHEPTPPIVRPTPPALKAPCRHKGAEVRRQQCGTCQGKVELKVFACGVHGECTAAKRADGVKGCCAGCMEYEESRPPTVTDPGRVRHLLYHVYPHARDGGAMWRWNVEQLKRRINLFNGRRVIGVAVGPETEQAAAVQEAFAGLGCEFVIRPNDPALREVVTFESLFSAVSCFTGPEHAVFYAQAKGVTSVLWCPTIRRWAESMYESCLDYWPAVRRLLQAHPLAGPWKRLNYGWPGRSSSTWHFSGSFRWHRCDDLFARDWRRIDRFDSGIEAHPSLHFRADEAAPLIHSFNGDGQKLYQEAFWAAEAQPALDRWRANHAADKRAPGSFTVVATCYNEEGLIGQFIDHYIEQGASRIFLIDNGSTDGTVAEASRTGAVEIEHWPTETRCEERRETKFQAVRESLAGLYDWVIVVDSDELIQPKDVGRTIADVLRLHPAATVLGCEGWAVVQRPEDPPLDWTRPILDQRKYGFLDISYGKPVVVRPAGAERWHAGRHTLRGPNNSEVRPPDEPFYLFHVPAVDEGLFMRRRMNLVRRQSVANTAIGLSIHYAAGTTEADLRQRFKDITTNPRIVRLPCA